MVAGLCPLPVLVLGPLVLEPDPDTIVLALAVGAKDVVEEGHVSWGGVADIHEEERMLEQR